LSFWIPMTCKTLGINLFITIPTSTNTFSYHPLDILLLSSSSHSKLQIKQPY